MTTSTQNSWDCLDFPEGDFEAFLFDCDGTLVNSMPLHYQGWCHAIREQGETFHFPEDLYYEQAGIETDKLVLILNERFGGNLDVSGLSKLKREFFLSQVHTMRELKPVADFARHVHPTHPVAVVTGGLKSIVKQSLEAAQLDHLFELIINFEDVENGKPAPDMFLYAAEQLGVAPDKCLVFEDGELGIQGARAAGMATVFIDRSHAQ
jgi:HAD superfamily hydrolase (TIGR01509 family)